MFAAVLWVGTVSGVVDIGKPGNCVEWFFGPQASTIEQYDRRQSISTTQTESWTNGLQMCLTHARHRFLGCVGWVR